MKLYKGTVFGVELKKLDIKKCSKNLFFLPAKALSEALNVVGRILKEIIVITEKEGLPVMKCGG